MPIRTRLCASYHGQCEHSSQSNNPHPPRGILKAMNFLSNSNSKKKLEDATKSAGSSRRASLKFKIPGVKGISEDNAIDLESEQQLIPSQSESMKPNKLSKEKTSTKSLATKISNVQLDAEIEMKKKALFTSQKSINSEISQRSNIQKSLSEFFQLSSASLDRQGKLSKSNLVSSQSLASLQGKTSPLETSLKISSPGTELAKKNIRLVVGTSLRAIKNYKARDENDIDLEEGDVVELLNVPESDDAEYWEGISRSWGANNGKKGLFPSAYVEVLLSTKP